MFDSKRVIIPFEMVCALLLLVMWRTCKPEIRKSVFWYQLATSAICSCSLLICWYVAEFYWESPEACAASKNGGFIGILDVFFIYASTFPYCCIAIHTLQVMYNCDPVNLITVTTHASLAKLKKLYMFINIFLPCLLTTVLVLFDGMGGQCWFDQQSEEGFRNLLIFYDGFLALMLVILFVIMAFTIRRYREFAKIYKRIFSQEWSASASLPSVNRQLIKLTHRAMYLPLAPLCTLLTSLTIDVLMYTGRTDTTLYKVVYYGCSMFFDKSFMNVMLFALPEFLDSKQQKLKESKMAEDRSSVHLTPLRSSHPSKRSRKVSGHQALKLLDTPSRPSPFLTI
eukprot:gnl/Dysnectes_brevis/4201_a5551_922.p1 GENE.gnl/Dysnectes_brevis/4201_a5551_922~~gnl/Dysnectes_brevis/4201_a5551_922.p1  ORF type:complete len:340 (+),score=7.33 gnl/Dysnectes_brevis/4201_a5551_922:86-1105(+)